MGRFALLIGNGEYEDTLIERLSTPTRDVHALSMLLADPAVGGFDQVDELLDESEVRIRRSISAFFRGRGRDDLLLLFFSGHGIKDERGRLFWAARDTQHDDLSATGIAAAYVSDHMDASTSKRQVLILDCCYGGAFMAGGKGHARVIDQATFQGNGYGRVVLTASDSTQYALEGGQVIQQAQLSLFTHFLIEGLSNGAAARPGAEVISLNDWYDYAYERVVAERPSQTPCKWGYNQKGELIIARNPRPVPLQPAKLPAELTESLLDPRPWIRLGVVDELGRILQGADSRMVLAAEEALKGLKDDDSLRVREAVARIIEDAEHAAPVVSGDAPEASSPTFQILPEEATSIDRTPPSDVRVEPSMPTATDIQGLAAHTPAALVNPPGAVAEEESLSDVVPDSWRSRPGEPGTFARLIESPIFVLVAMGIMVLAIMFFSHQLEK